MSSSNTHITILATPGLGHIIPTLELAKRIVAFDNYQVSLIVLHTDASSAQSQLLGSVILPRRLEIVNIPLVNISSYLDDDAHMLARMSIIVRESLPDIQSCIVKIPRPTILVVDMFGTSALDIAAENIVNKYVFFPSNATLLAFMMYLPILDKEVDGEFTHLQGPIQIPGCNPVHVEELIEPILNRGTEAYQWFLYHASRLKLATGILVNTCESLERTSLEALRENPILQPIRKKSVHAVGPFIRQMDDQLNAPEDKCMTWLYMQPHSSVLLVPFGSGGTLSTEQMTELAWGLELSQQRFIWIVRNPFDSNTSGTLFSVGGEQSNPIEYLPDGFMNRVKDVGLVVPSWAPQVDILAHKATGGFLSHCGWNSTLESIVHGVPIIAWPLYAEQAMNAKLLVQELGVAVRSRADYAENGTVVRREEIERVVRLVMEDKKGHSLRSRVNELKNDVLGALDREHGSSYNSLSQVFEQWKTECVCIMGSVNTTKDRVGIDGHSL